MLFCQIRLLVSELGRKWVHSTRGTNTEVSVALVKLSPI